ncbi:MAG: tetratricopeptide repeat protein [Nitrospirae bacterium]|nr:tetratricopeptide repeat protein [Candidatus Troglogloeales bacterium]
MRRQIPVYIILLSAVVAYAQGPEQRFDQGNKLYQQGKFAEARDAYDVLLREGFVSGDLYYNLGNTYYKTSNMAKAIVSYERGLRLTPKDEDLAYNLHLANLMITDKIEPVPHLLIWDYWDSARNAFSARVLFWITYAFFTLTVLLLILFILARSYKTRKLALVGSGCCALLFALFLFVCVTRISELRRDDMAILMGDIVILKNAPDVKSTDAFVLHSGVKVQIIDKVGNWIKIRIADGKVGWMQAEAAEII